MHKQSMNDWCCDKSVKGYTNCGGCQTGRAIFRTSEGKKAVVVLPEIAACVLIIEIKGIMVIAEQQVQWQKGEQSS